MMRTLLSLLLNWLSSAGLLIGTMFFVASLTPTLVPRTLVTQGVLSGVSFAVGYGFGVLGQGLWTYLELPRTPALIHRFSKIVVALLCLIGSVAVGSRIAEWQNSIRKLMHLEPVSTAHPIKVFLIAVATAVLLFVLVRLFGVAVSIASRVSRRFLPRRLANLAGLAFSVIVFWGIANGLIFHVGLKVLDSSFAAADAVIEPETAISADPLKSGSASSLIRWSEMGRTGRAFVSRGPTANQIRAFVGGAALNPIRVYVGLGAADTLEERATLALEELKRVGAFDRALLIVITPTGTGWIDPAAIDSVEYLHRGSVASVALQYSYLSSPLSLIVEPEYGEEAARALFTTVYSYWTTLPRESRPKLFLHGLSLGSLNSEKSLQLFDILADPIDGALWSGPPFASGVWRSIVNQRNSQSPAWLPEFRDGSYVRFMNQHGTTSLPNTKWGPMRVVYLQYASDPVTFFDYRDLYREPAWMKEPRGPDVSPYLRWYPVVTMLQLGLDMAVATSTPVGFGHVFAPQHYVDAWIAVTDLHGWSEGEIVRLKEHLAAEQRRWLSDSEGNAYENRGG